MGLKCLLILSLMLAVAMSADVREDTEEERMEMHCAVCKAAYVVAVGVGCVYAASHHLE